MQKSRPVGQRKKEKEIAEAFIQEAQNIAASYQSVFNALSEARVSNLEVEKERELKAAGNNAAAKEKIEIEYNRKIGQEKIRQAKLDKVLGLFNVSINSAQGIIKALAAFPGPVGIGLAVAIGAAGALQAAAIAAQPLPKFKKGTKNAPKGLALVGEEGFELVERNGKMFVTNNKPEVTYLKGGEKIFTHTESKKLLRSHF